MSLFKIRYLLPLLILAAVIIVNCSGGGGGGGNTAPAADSQALSTNEDTPLSITLSGSDSDGDDLTYTVASQPIHGNLSGTAPALTYTPDANFNGSDNFTFSVNDGTVESTVATITITVQAVNDAPVATDAAESSYPGDTVTGTLSATDVDGDSLTFSIVSQGTKGVATITDVNTGAYSYSPNAGAIDTDSFTFKANDGTLDSNTATVTITDQIPGTPTSGLGASGGDQRVTVTWDAVAGADSYTVYWSDTPGTGTGGTAVTGITAPPFYHDGRTNGTAYYYVISAVNAAGESTASSQVSATPADILLSSLSFSDTNLATCFATATSGLTYVHEVTTLGSSCTSKSIASISGLEALTSMANLNLGNNSISDVTPLQTLTQITVLSLSGNSITNLQPLSRLTAVTQLTLNMNGLTDLTGLENMTGMLRLQIYTNSISDLSPLAGMTSLEWLYAYQNNISDVTPLSGMTSLTQLWLEENSIVDVSPLSGLSSIINLALSNNSIVDVSPLASVTSVQVLKLLTNSIGGQGVGNVDSLSTLTSATAIYLGSNLTMSCAEITSLIAALGAPPVNIHPTGSTPSPAPLDGSNCTNP